MSNDERVPRGFFRRLFHGAEMPDDDWQRDTRKQFVSSLRTRLSAAADRLGQGGREEKKEIVARIEDLLQRGNGLPDWRDAFEAEQLICFVQTGPLVNEEIRGRLTEAESKSVAGTADRAQRFRELLSQSPAADDGTKQAFLFGLVVDLQRLAQKSYQVRQMRLGAVRFVMILAIFAIALIAVPLFIYIVYSFSANGQKTWIADFVKAIPNYGLFSAVSFGILGALFGRFILLQNSEMAVPIDEAAAYYSRRYFLLRVFIGMVGAIIVYFFLGSGLIEGAIVPDIRALTFIASRGLPAPDGIAGEFFTSLGTSSNVAMVPGKDYALLVVWSFLAGFSERLVPNLLNDTAGRIESASKSASAPK